MPTNGAIGLAKTKPKPKAKPKTSATLPLPSFPTAAGPPAVKLGLPTPVAQGTIADPPSSTMDPTVAGGSGSTNFAALAASIFGPQMNDLNAQEGSLRSQAGAADSSLADMYAGLVKSINGDAQFYNQDNAQAQGALKQINSGAHASINNTYDQSAAKEAAILERLGIQQAAPDVLQQGTTDRNFFGDLIDSNNNAYQNQFTAEHKADLTWNKQQGEVSQLNGADARAKVAQQLQASLAQLGSQRASLLSQQAQEAQTLQQQQASNDLDYAKLALDSNNASTKAATAASTGKGLQSLLAQEATAIGYNPASAPNAIKAINDSVQYAQPQNADSLQDFLAFVHSRNKNANDWGQLQDLAEYLWKQTNGRLV